MVLPLIGLAAGIARGYGEGKQREREQARQDENDAWTREERDAIRQERKQQSELRRGLSDAAAPASMAPVEGSMLPEDQAGPSLALYRVKGSGIDKVTADQSQATQAMTDYNAPEAVAGRQANAYRAAGAPDKAMSLENLALDRKRSNEKYSQESKINQFKIDEEEQKKADAKWRQKIGAALFQPGETAISGLANLYSESEFGPMKGKKVKDVLSKDGKTVTIHMINPNGSTTPTSLQFSNDQNGAIQAAYLLDQSVKPEDRYKDFVQGRKIAVDEKNADTNKLRAERMGLSGTGGKGQGDPLGGKKLTISQAREKRLDIKGQIADTFKELELELITPEDARRDIKALKQQQAKYDKIIEDDEAPGAPKPGAAQGSSAIPAPVSKAEYDKLPKGAQYRHPSGDVRIKG